MTNADKTQEKTGLSALVDLLIATKNRKIGAVRIMDPRWVAYDARIAMTPWWFKLLLPLWLARKANVPATPRWLEYAKWTQGGQEVGWGWWATDARSRPHTKTATFIQEDPSALARIEVALTVLEEQDAEIAELVGRVAEAREARRQVAAELASL